MKIGYMGDGPWAHLAFDKIIADDRFEIAFVTVRYDKKDPVLLEKAKAQGIPIEISSNINSAEFIDVVKKCEVDIIVSMSFNQIFKSELINLPPLKTINCHAGKLPFYRGRNILNWALINDEKEFGITVHYVDEGIDTGDIIIQNTYDITDDDDYGTLLERAYVGCADTLYAALDAIALNKVNAIEQSSIDTVGLYCGVRMVGDEIIDWNQSSRDIFNFVRAISKPGPMATSWINGKKILINHVREVKGARAYKNTVGQVVGRTEKGFFVKTNDTIVEVYDYEYDGKIRIGDRLVNYE